MKITYSLSEEDQKKLASTNPLTKHQVIGISIALLFLLGISICLFFVKEPYAASISLLYTALLAYLFLCQPKAYMKKSLKESKETGALDEVKTIELKEDELIISRPLCTAIYKYSAITDIKINDNDFIQLTFKPEGNFNIPADAFSSEEQKADFINTIKLKAHIGS